MVNGVTPEHSTIAYSSHTLFMNSVVLWNTFALDLYAGDFTLTLEWRKRGPDSFWMCGATSFEGFSGGSTLIAEYGLHKPSFRVVNVPDKNEHHVVSRTVMFGITSFLKVSFGIQAIITG